VAGLPAFHMPLQTTMPALNDWLNTQQ
jgi:hypothetical protein